MVRRSTVPGLPETPLELLISRLKLRARKELARQQPENNFLRSLPFPLEIKMLASTSRPLVAAARATGRRNASAIATKYSGAAYKAALASSPATLTKVSEELSAIAKSLKDTPALNAFVSNPLLSSKERATGLESLYKAGSPKGTVNDITKNLLAVLSENGRLAETPAVIEEFNALVAKYKGELEIVVTSAQPLTKDILTKLEASLKQSEAAKQSKVLKFTNKVMLL